MVDEFCQVLLTQDFVVHGEWNFNRHDLGEKYTTYGRILNLALDTALDLGLKTNHAGVISIMHFGWVREQLAFTLSERTLASHVVQTQDDVLRRYDDWLTVSRRKDVVGRHHQYASFDLSFDGKRNVNGHLVTVE